MKSSKTVSYTSLPPDQQNKTNKTHSTALPYFGSQMSKTRSQRTLIGRNKNVFYWLIGERTKLQRRTQLQRYALKPWGKRKWSLFLIGNEGTNHVSTLLMFVFINVPTIRLSLSVELHSRIRENNHAMLNQLGPTVHHSSRFDSITIS